MCKNCKINKRRDLNKYGEWAFFGKKLVHNYNCNKRGVEGGKNLRNQETWTVDFFKGWIFFKIGKHDFTIIREMKSWYLIEDSSYSIQS